MFTEKKIKCFRFKADGWKNDMPTALEMVRNNLAKPLDLITDEVNIGWAAGKSELILDVNETNSTVGEYLYLSMRIAVKKIPSGIANALLRKKIAEYMAVNHVSYISRKVKEELKDEVAEFLLPRVMPTVKSVWVVICPDGVVFAGSVSTNDLDSLCVLFQKTFDIELKTVTEFVQPGQKFSELYFLTDLFRQSDTLTADNFSVSAPFTFVSTTECDVATGATIKGDVCNRSSEVASALNNRKLLKKVNLNVCADGENAQTWKFTLDGNGGLSGLVCPESEEIEHTAVFCEKVQSIRDLFDWIDLKYQIFLKNEKNIKQLFYTWIIGK